MKKKSETLTYVTEAEFRCVGGWKVYRLTQTDQSFMLPNARCWKCRFLHLLCWFVRITRGFVYFRFLFELKTNRNRTLWIKMTTCGCSVVCNQITNLSTALLSSADVSESLSSALCGLISDSALSCWASRGDETQQHSHAFFTEIHQKITFSEWNTERWDDVWIEQ